MVSLQSAGYFLFLLGNVYCMNLSCSTFPFQVLFVVGFRCGDDNDLMIQKHGYPLMEINTLFHLNKYLR